MMKRIVAAVAANCQTFAVDHFQQANGTDVFVADFHAVFLLLRRHLVAVVQRFAR